MYDNNISSIKPLQKSLFKKLEVITIYNNYMNEVNVLNRGNFPKLTGYELD